MDLLTKKKTEQEEQIPSPVKLDFRFTEDGRHHPFEVQGHGGKEAFLSRCGNAPLSDV